jgi:hypothetical protein
MANGEGRNISQRFIIAPSGNGNTTNSIFYDYMPVSVFCSQSLPDFVQQECGIELGGIVAIAIIDRDQEPSMGDLYTLSFWQTKIAASPQKYFPIQNTRGSYGGGTPTEEEGYGKVVTVRTGADHEINLEVQGVKDNRSFWAVVNQTSKWNLVLITNGEQGFYIEDVSIYATPVIDQNIKSQIRMKVNIKWSDDMSNPQQFDASALDSIFSN